MRAGWCAWQPLTRPPTHTQSELTASDDANALAAAFTRLLLSGDILPSLRPFSKLWSPSPAAADRDIPHPRMLPVVQEVRAAGVRNRRTLAERMGRQPRWLLAEMCALLKRPQQRQLQEQWMGVLAEAISVL